MGIFLNILFLVIGFVMLIKGADWFVDGASSLAKKFGIPQIVIGLTVVAFGTSLPEASVSITAAVQGKSSVAIGNIVGSNIANVLLILGVCGLMAKNGLNVKKQTLWIEIPFVIVLTTMLLLMGYFDGYIGRIDGAVFLVLFVAFIAYLALSVKRDKKLGLAEPEEETQVLPVWKIIVFLLLGAVCVVAGGTFVVDTATALVGYIGLSQNFAGLVIVAIGTSLPELVTSVIATRKGEQDIAIGNIVGSNIFNILFVIGMSSVISPVQFAPSFLWDTLVAIAAAVMLFVAVAVTKKKQLGRIGGGLMTASYIGYFVYILLASRV